MAALNTAPLVDWVRPALRDLADRALWREG
jgi:hypothetical protein